VLDAIERERDFERAKAFFEATEKNADYRAAVLMAHLHNTSGFAEEAREAADYFPYFASLRDVRESAESAELSTEQTVAYLKSGFSLYIPR
jgi:hypothetical protein